MPSTPAVLDTDADGFADVVFIGDLGGNLWKWVIHPIGEDRANDGSGVRTQPNWKFHKFFQASTATQSGTVYYKNLFQPPAAALVNNKLWLAFGSGERAAIGFLGRGATVDDNNRYYVLNDPDPLLTGATPAALTEASLTNITTVGTTVTSTRGYYFKVAEGEKFVTTSVIFAGKVIAGSFLPSQLKAGDPGFDPCTQRGSGNLYKFNLTTGVGDYRDASNNESRYTSLGTGLPTDPKVSIGVGGDDNKIVIQKSGTEIEILDTDDASFGRGIIYWRELK
jgi:type IV pilus assembly protein PilY1